MIIKMACWGRGEEIQAARNRETKEAAMLRG
jgi:hypothetical protein